MGLNIGKKEHILLMLSPDDRLTRWHSRAAWKIVAAIRGAVSSPTGQCPPQFMTANFERNNGLQNTVGTSAPVLMRITGMFLFLKKTWFPRSSQSRLAFCPCHLRKKNLQPAFFTPGKESPTFNLTLGWESSPHPLSSPSYLCSNGTLCLSTTHKEGTLLPNKE